jgi:hypothetical protein
MRAFVPFLLTFLASSVAAQPQGSTPPVLSAELVRWRAEHGASWRIEVDDQTGYVRFLYGGSARARVAPRSDAEWTALALAWLRETRGLHGVEPATLGSARALFLPLGSAGSTDKVTVRFDQAFGGVEVVRGTMNVLFDARGALLSIDSTALPAVAALDVRPALSADVASERAAKLFAADTALAPERITEPALVVEQLAGPTGRHGILAWHVEAFSGARGGVPEGYAYWIDARSGALLRRAASVHTFDVSGTVTTLASPGLLPDKGGNPPSVQPAAHLLVTSAQGNAVTDANGNFTIPGATPPLQVTVRYDGPFTTTTNSAGPTYSLSANLAAASGNALFLNPGPSAQVTAEANSAVWIHRLRDWTRSVNPGDPTADFDALSHVNIAATCNAYFDGGSVNFFLAGGGCVNTAYSTIVGHEMGHWLNVRYGSGNGPDGFGEGNADVFAMYLADDPIVGRDFCGTGCYIRTGLNTKPFCGDQNIGCYGQVHADGEVLMGALWKVRSRLKASLGASAGAAAADLLFNSWMNAYNDGQIKTIIEIHWLTLDDDNGTLDDGTPHFADIDGGFRDQKFPGFALPAIALYGVTVLGNTLDEAGPYLVDAKASSNTSPPVTSVFLHWRVDKGAFQSVAMAPTGGLGWQAAIPGQTSPAVVEYYVEATDFGFSTQTFPKGAPAELVRFVVGEEQVYYFDDLEVPSILWIHGQKATEDDWQWGIPMNKGGDPKGAYSGLYAWGNDLGIFGQDGLYSNGVDNWLRSPPIDLSKAVRPILRFRRWLTVEDGAKDRAEVRVNGSLVWSNPVGSAHVDTAWIDQEIDISAVAAGVNPTYVEWSLTSDAAITYGGWSLDDVQVLVLSAVGQACSEPVAYCTAKATSAGIVPSIGAQGAPSASLGNLAVELFDVMPGKAGVIFYGSAPSSQPFLGGTLCVQAPLVRGPSFTGDAFGYALVPFQVLPALVGQTKYLQAWFRDPQDPSAVGLTGGLEVGFCP